MRYLQLYNKILSTGEKHLQLDTRYFIKGGLYSSIQQIIGISSGLIISYLFGHLISKVLFGEYNLILSFVSMITFLSLPGIDTALTRSIGEGHDQSFFQAISQKIHFGLLGTPILGSIGLYYLIVENRNNIAYALFVIALAYPILNTFSLYRSFLTAKQKFAHLAFFASLSSLFFLGSTAIAIFFVPTTVGLICAYSFGMIAPSFIAYKYCNRFITQKSTRDITLPSYGKFLTALSIIPWISANLGNIVLAKLAGVEALAIYSVASRFLTAVQKNYIVFHKPITAKLAQQSHKEHYQLLGVHWLKFILIGFLLAIGLYVATSLLITFFFTNTYSESIYYGKLLSFALIPLPLTWVLDDIIIYQKEKLPQIITAIIPGLVKIILYFLVIPSMNILGLVLITLIDRFTSPLIPLGYLLIKQASKNR